LIYKNWEDLPALPAEVHETKFIDALSRHGFSDLRLVVPLKARYTKGRRWSEQDLVEAIDAWHKKKSITFVAACLNRNPQDMIYKLLDYCKSKNIVFTQKYRSEGSSEWNERTKLCAEELFENGLPAWKIAAIFRVDFEHVEKELFVKRDQYGHNKKNPFGINTDHKQLVNVSILQSSDVLPSRVFEPFAGEGRFTKSLSSHERVKEIVCVEQDETTIETFKKNITSSKVSLYHDDNLNQMGKSELGKFNLIDLDPFVTCHEQLTTVWQHLNDDSLLFVTFGGEYRRSFIKTNRQSIANRYGFIDIDCDNKSYLEIVPFFFLGHVAKIASENNFKFNVIRAVRYANNCRFWLKMERVDINKSIKWLSESTKIDHSGYLYFGLKMPRFREVRAEIDNARNVGDF
jgi:hypothetical protein